MKGEIYKKGNIWLEQILKSRKTAPVMSMREQVAKTRALKKDRGPTENKQCRLCKEQRETVQHLLAVNIQQDITECLQ